jgi:predicted 3-demethylubiquinone-9 3-methyltransferase (glyoxalase superfamily)
MDQSRITPCLWFDKEAEEAARFYASVIPDTRIDSVERAPGDYPAGKAGDVLMVEMTLGGMKVTAMNGGPFFKFNEAISLQLSVEDQAQLDHLYSTLSAVPQAEQCGWIKDRYGLSWQLVPKAFVALMKDPDPAVRTRVFEAMMPMKRLDIAALEAAARA